MIFLAQLNSQITYNGRVGAFLQFFVLLSLFVAKIRRSPLRYAGLDTDPDVTYERMPNIHFPIDGEKHAYSSRLHAAPIPISLLHNFHDALNTV